MGQKNIFWSLLVPLLFSAAVAGTDCVASESAEDFVAWAEQSAIHLDTLDWRAADREKLASLDAALRRKRIVYLGEPDHYIHEKYAFRLIMIQYLVKKGWRHIGMEMGRSDGLKLDRYLQTGDETFLDKMGAYGCEDHKRADRDDEPSGLFNRMKHNLEASRPAFRAEERRFAAHLLEINRSRPKGTPPVRFFGFDVDLIPGSGYGDLDAILAEADREAPFARLLRKGLQRVSGETRTEELERINRIVEEVRKNEEALVDLLGEERGEIFRQTLLTLRDSFAVTSSAFHTRSPIELMDALARRETVMYRHFDEYMERLGPGEKVILMGHNLHLSKDSASLSGGPLGAPIALWRTIGTHVAQSLPGEAYSIWLLYDRSQNSGYLSPEPVVDIPSKPDAVEHLLARAGTHFVLPLEGALREGRYLSEARNFTQNGEYGSGVIPRQADAIFFVETVSALRLE